MSRRTHSGRGERGAAEEENEGGNLRFDVVEVLDGGGCGSGGGGECGLRLLRLRDCYGRTQVGEFRVLSMERKNKNKNILPSPLKPQ